MHITITGNLGSGKSTICKIMENQYGFEIYSTGKVQRELARQMNMTTLEMNQLMCSDPKYDTMIDDETAKISRENKEKKIIFDSRLAWNFVEESFKIFLSVSLPVAANRVFNDNRGSEEQYKDVEEAKKLLAARAETEDKRYKDMYNLNYFDFSNYNLVIDSTILTSDEIAAIIMEEATKYYEKLEANKASLADSLILLSPKRLFQGDLSKEQSEAAENVSVNVENKNYLSANITVTQDGDDYKIVTGQDELFYALSHNIPYVKVIIV